SLGHGYPDPVAVAQAVRSDRRWRALGWADARSVAYFHRVAVAAAGGAAHFLGTFAAPQPAGARPGHGHSGQGRALSALCCDGATTDHRRPYHGGQWLRLEPLRYRARGKGCRDSMDGFRGITAFAYCLDSSDHDPGAYRD